MPTRQTTESFIASARRVHGDTYDYSRVAYTNQSTPVEIICKHHGSFFQKPVYHTLNAAGCPACSGNARITTESFVTRAKKLHGDTYDYSAVSVTNNTTPVTIICKTHGPFQQAPKLHLKGRGCPSCGGTMKLTHEQVLDRFAKAHGDTYGYSLVEYTSAKREVTVICPTHGEFRQIASLHWEGRGCPKCAKQTLAAKFRTPLPDVQAALSANRPGYTYDLSGYVNNKSHITITCDKGHVFTQVANDARTYGCPTCAKRHSTGEREMREYITSLGFTPICTRKIAPPTEIDVWVESKRIGFEYNGLYYHSDAYEGAKWRHHAKSTAVRSAGGRLVHIWSDDWDRRRTAVETMIAAQLGVLPRVHARQTTVRPLATSESTHLLNTYHLQGHTPATYLGLEYDGRVVAAMGFARARSVRGNTDEGLIELVRFVSNAKVVGGASKLLKAWMRSIAPSAWHTLVTYCDLAQFDGSLYEALGFTKVRVSGPDYKVILAGGKELKHKSSVRKSRLKALLGDKFDDAKSESELCAENYIYRVWDCGKAKYILKNAQ